MRVILQSHESSIPCVLCRGTYELGQALCLALVMGRGVYSACGTKIIDSVSADACTQKATQRNMFTYGLGTNFSSEVLNLLLTLSHGLRNEHVQIV